MGVRRSETWDVVVVGGGSAAFEAAVASREAGADSVVMLEKAPQGESGGNARFSHTGFRFVHSGIGEIAQFVPAIRGENASRFYIPPYTERDFHADLERVSKGNLDPALAEVLVADSNAALHWMLDLGIRWELVTHVDIDGIAHFERGNVIGPAGGGLGQLAQWSQIAAKLGVVVRHSSAVVDLLGNNERIEGVRIRNPESEYEIRARAVVLCSGGFQANRSLRTRYLGQNADAMKVRGSRHNTGEVLELAVSLGAATAGQWDGAHATPVDTRAPDFESGSGANRYSYPFGITVNAMGQRFFDEGTAEAELTYAITGWRVLEESGGVAYQLFDAKTVGLLTKRYTEAVPIEADSIAELAVKLGIEPALLGNTIENYNAAVLEDVQFDPTRPDGKMTVGILPPKSNWAVRLDTPPFHAYPVTGGITFTFGGLAVNSDARVLNTRRIPIDGLYASGDIVGLFHNNYPSCSGQTRNAVLSRRAGAHIGS